MIRLIRHIRQISRTGLRRFISLIRPIGRILNIRPIRFLRRNRKKAFMVGLTLLVLLSSLATYLTFFAVKETKAAWFDDSYNYRQYFSFTHNADIASERAITVSLDTAEFIAAGVMQADCDDTRFTDINGKLLRYQLTGTCNNAATTYEVVYPTIVNGPNPAYVYYGNLSAPSASENVSGVTALTPSGGDPAITTRTAEEKGPSPQMYLKFDEGTDNTCSGGTNDACDQTSFGNSGAISNGTAWKTEDLCLSGKCLFYDGTDDITTVTNASSIDLDQELAGAFTFQAWIRPNGAGEGTGGQIFYKGTNTWLRVDTLSGGKLDIEASLDLATTDATLNVSQAVEDNRWTQVVVSYTDDADDEITIYVNGNSAGSSTNGVGAPAADTNNVLIGGITTNNFKGFIDEFKIYKTERTSAEIKTDFLRGSASLHGTSASFGVRDYSYLSDGLVGYWKMDEASWTNDCSTTSVTDSSGNSLNLRSCPASTGPTGNGVGKFGGAGDFDGSDDLLSRTDSSVFTPANDMTISAWVYLDQLASTKGEAQMFVRKEDGSSPFQSYQFYQDVTNNTFCFQWINDSRTTHTKCSTSALTAGVWYHLVGVKEGSDLGAYINGIKSNGAAVTTTGTLLDSNGVFTIGAASATSKRTDGRIDDVRLYSRALNGVEVASLYNWAPGPVAHWKLDDNTGTTAVDSSGNDNSLTLSSTSWSVGRFGSAWNGTAANWLSRADDADFDFPAANNFSIGLWFKSDSATNPGANEYLVDKETGTGYAVYITTGGLATFGIDSDGTWTPADTAASTADVYDGAWHHIEAVKTGTSRIDIYVDGVLVGSDTTIAATGDLSNADVLSVGDQDATDDGDEFAGDIDNVQIYNYARTTSQIIEDMNAGHPPPAGGPGSPIGSSVIYWKFDEQQGTTANNSGIDGALDGTATGTVWRLENSTSGGCKLNGCQNVDTASDSISAGDTSFTDSLSAMTASFWTNPQTLTVDDTIVSKTNLSTQNSFLIRTDSTNSDEIRVYIASSLTDTANYYTTNNLDLTAAATYANWQQVTVVYDGGLAAADRVKVYKDAVLKGGSVTGTIPASMTSGSTSALRVGDSDITGSEALLTYIDEVKIYNFALTADQVKVDATAGSSAAFGGVLGTHDNEGFGGNPPLGWWKLDENTGTSTVNDHSGNGNNGTMNGGMTESDWVPGKFGSALDFDGTDDYISTTTQYSNPTDFSVAVWFNTTVASGAKIVGFENQQTGTGSTQYDRHIYMGTDGKIRYGVYSGGGQTIASSNTLNDGKWHYAVGTTNSSSTLSSLFIDGVLQGTMSFIGQNFSGYWRIGSYKFAGFWASGSDGYFTGQIDEVKIYNYARSAAQIAYDYNRGGPIGYWKLDECTGTTANDSSGPPAGGGNNGTITIGATGSNTSNGTCGGSAGQGWFDGKTGKRNASLEFDGTDDRVDMGNPTDLQLERTSPMTFEAWVKTTADQATTVFAKQESSVNFRGYGLHFGTGGFFFFQLVNIYSSNTLEVRPTNDTNYDDGNWHHIVVTYDGSSTGAGVTLYFDGISVPKTITVDSLSATILNSVNFYVGSRNNTERFFNGQIDEPKIYNYSLTADQVKRDYNYGAQFFGPNVGSP